MIEIVLEFTGTAECSDIMANIRLDSLPVGKYHCGLAAQQLRLTCDDSPADRTLTIEVSGKSQHHTIVDADGNISSDASILLSGIWFEGIDMLPVFAQGAPCYTHSFNNPAAEPIVDEFYGYLGCNGVVEFKFQTPIYLWFNKHFL